MGSLLRGNSINVGPYTLSVSPCPVLMGILNITPDSFSDIQTRTPTPHIAFKRAQALVAAGAQVLDLGAESTRPNAKPVSAAEEKRRLLPVLQLVRKLQVPISVDTSKPEVAEAALDAGAHMINDVTGLRHPAMRKLAAQRQVPVVIMHMRGTPQTMQKNPRYRNVVEEVRDELLASAYQAEKAGVRREYIILDPGIGFGKTPEHNFKLMNNLSRLVDTGYKVLVGPSRKSFIAAVLGPLPPHERIWGTAAAVALSVAQGIHMVRVHDVREMGMVTQVAQAIAFSGKQTGRAR